MPKKTAAQRDTERRAEVRRRARLQAQGRDHGEEEDDEAAAAPARPPAVPLLQRIFPQSPPLAGKPDPMAGFTYDGPLRLVVANLWLIPRNLYAGVGMGVLWAAAYILTVQEAGSVIGSVASFVSFGALVAAGWIGWQRPWLYGLVAGILGYILFATFFTYLVANDPKAAAAITTSQLATYLLTNGVVQAGIGTLAGFYGGYLRRRLADPSIRRTSSARPRR